MLGGHVNAGLTWTPQKQLEASQTVPSNTLLEARYVLAMPGQ